MVAAKDTALRTLAQAVAIVLNEDQTPPGQVRPSIYAQVPREDLMLAWEAVQTMLYPTRHSHLSFLAKRYSLFKQFTPRLLEQLGFRQGFAGDDFGAALQLVSELQAGAPAQAARAGPDRLPETDLAQVRAGRRAQRRAAAGRPTSWPCWPPCATDCARAMYTWPLRTATPT